MQLFVSGTQPFTIFTARVRRVWPPLWLHDVLGPRRAVFQRPCFQQSVQFFARKMAGEVLRGPLPWSQVC